MSNWFQYDAVREAALEQHLRDDEIDGFAAEPQEQPQGRRGLRALLATLGRRAAQGATNEIARQPRPALGEGRCD